MLNWCGRTFAAESVKFIMEVHNKRAHRFCIMHFCVLNEYGILTSCSICNIITHTVPNYHHVIYWNVFM
jgi:hypothetical protein